MNPYYVIKYKDKYYYDCTRYIVRFTYKQKYAECWINKIDACKCLKILQSFMLPDLRIVRVVQK